MAGHNLQPKPSPGCCKIIRWTFTPWCNAFGGGCCGSINIGKKKDRDTLMLRCIQRRQFRTRSIVFGHSVQLLCNHGAHLFRLFTVPKRLVQKKTFATQFNGANGTRRRSRCTFLYGTARRRVVVGNRSGRAAGTRSRTLRALCCDRRTPQ